MTIADETTITEGGEAIPLEEARLCLDCGHVVRPYFRNGACPVCASEAGMWLKAYLDLPAWKRKASWPWLMGGDHA